MNLLDYYLMDLHRHQDLLIVITVLSVSDSLYSKHVGICLVK